VSDETGKPPMRVSDWGKSSGAEGPSAPAFVPPPGLPGPAGPGPTAAVEPEFALPVDPWRLLGGLWKRRRMLLVAVTAGVVLGFAAGLFKAKTRYIATAQLIKRDTPSTFRTSETGEAFRPRELSGGTLLGAAASDNVLRRVALKASPPVTVEELQGAIEVKEQRNTDFVFLTLSGFRSREATVDLVNLWAAEAVQFTRELQSQESHEMRVFLQQQVDSTDAELHKVNDQILEFSKRENLVDVNKQVDSYLRSFEEVDLKYETARIDLETIDFKIAGVEEELKRQSPLSEKLRTAKSELDDLRSRYTDENPLVSEKQETVKTLEKQIKDGLAAPSTDPASYAGTFLGNTLYLNLVQYQNEKKALMREKEELVKLRDQARNKLDSIPEKAAAFAQLGLRKQSLEIARNLLFSRLREAQMFEENSPGYYRVFQESDINHVIARGRFLKVALIMGGVTFALLMLAVMAALVMELLDPKLRTAPEASLALKVPVLGVIPQRGSDPEGVAEIWARWITAEQAAGMLRVVWVPAPGAFDQQFWTPLFGRASVLLPSLRVVHCGQGPAPEAGTGRVRVEHVDTEQFSIQEAQRFGAALREDCGRGQSVWLCLAGPVHEPLTTMARAGTAPLVLVSLHTQEAEFWKTQGELLQKTLGQAAGLVAMGEIPWNERT